MYHTYQYISYISLSKYNISSNIRIYTPSIVKETPCSKPWDVPTSVPKRGMI